MRPFLTLHDPGQARSFYGKGLWGDDTFYDLMCRHAEHMPSAHALRDGSERIDWRTLRARVDALADDFAERGIVAGDRVSIWMPSSVDVVVAFLACSRIGAACNPSLHHSYTCAQIVDLLTMLQASALLTAEGWGVDRDRHNFEEMTAKLPFLKKIYKAGRLPMHITHISADAHDNPDSVAYLAFTSGSTGTPKCVMHSCNTLLANARNLVSDWGISKKDVILTLSPLSHHIGWVAAAQWLLSGAEFVLYEPKTIPNMLSWIEETGASYVLGVPTHAMDLLSEQKLRAQKSMGKVRIFYMAGAPIPDAIARSFAQQGIKPQNIYGMTECSSHQYTHPDDPLEVAVATCGRGGTAYEVKIWDPQDPDREMPAGETGEIGGRGAALMLGYYANQAATEKTFNRHGYLLSGDLGSFDADGNLRVEGRIKDLIIRGGHNIFPSRIEALAATHPRVEKVAAFPVPDERLGEKVCIAVIGEISARELIDHLAAEGLSKYDMPEWFISLPAMPLTPSGKILKRELTEMVRRSEIAPEPVRYTTPKVASR